MNSAMNVPCLFCGERHLMFQCTRLRAVEFHPDGSVHRVEFVTLGDLEPAHHVHHHRHGEASSSYLAARLR